MKSKTTAYFLWLIGILGCLGLHRFYLGKIKTGFLWLCTGGLAGIGSLIDLFSLGEQVNQVNRMAILVKLSRGEKVTEMSLTGKNRKINIETNSYCPYCMGILGHKPNRNIKCLFCLKEIYFRPKQTLFDHTLLTRENAVITDHFKELVQLGISKTDYFRQKDLLFEKFGGEIIPIDVIWSLLYRIIQQPPNPGVHKKATRLLATLLNELGKDCYYIIYRYHKMQLLELQKDGYTKSVRVISSNNNVCPFCRDLIGQSFKIEEALRLMPVPCKVCTTKLTKDMAGFCHCSYQAES